jgi:hypothetical protein
VRHALRRPTEVGVHPVFATVGGYFHPADHPATGPGQAPDPRYHGLGPEEDKFCNISKGSYKEKRTFMYGWEALILVWEIVFSCQDNENQ